jgi:hypothetical protein
MDDRDLVAEASEEERLLECGIPAADDEDVLVAEEGAVARCAGRHAVVLEPLFGLEPEPASARTGGDDHRACLVLLVFDPHVERPLGEVDARHVVGDEVGAEALRLSAELAHHLGAHDSVGVPGIVLHVARDHELAAPAEALDHERLQICARSIKGRRVTRGPSSDHDHVTYVAHRFLSQKVYALLNELGRTDVPEA